MSENNEQLARLYGLLQNAANETQTWLIKARGIRNELIKHQKNNKEFQAYDETIKSVEQELGKIIEQLQKLRDDEVNSSSKHFESK